MDDGEQDEEDDEQRADDSDSDDSTIHWNSSLMNQFMYFDVKGLWKILIQILGQNFYYKASICCLGIAFHIIDWTSTLALYVWVD